jgi:hypothetical protein
LFASATRQFALSFEKIAASQAQDCTQQSVGSTSGAAKRAASFLAPHPATDARGDVSPRLIKPNRAAVSKGPPEAMACRNGSGDNRHRCKQFTDGPGRPPNFQSFTYS